MARMSLIWRTSFASSCWRGEAHVHDHETTDRRPVRTDGGERNPARDESLRADQRGAGGEDDERRKTLGVFGAILASDSRASSHRLACPDREAGRIPQEDSEPEPDVSVARGGIDDYEDRQPGPEDVALVVEVAESTLADDRAMAVPYGGGGIPVFWIVNIPGRQLEVYANPAGGAYPAPTILAEKESVDLTIGGQVVGRIAVADLLPRRS